jgi:cytochrome oxidase assembly protein ShyY1
MIWIGGAAALVCAGLGTWQWNRYNWRLDFIQQQSTLANQLPIDM